MCIRVYVREDVRERVYEREREEAYEKDRVRERRVFALVRSKRKKKLIT